MAGVILNRVGTPRHEQVLRQACESVGVPVLGALPRLEELSVPSRHLGLVTAAEHGDRARDAVAAMTDLVSRHIDLDAVRALAGSAVTEPWSPREAVGAPVTGSPVVAIAAGPAFTFSYAEHAELLRAAGAEVVGFDPPATPCPRRRRRWCFPADSRAVPRGTGRQRRGSDRDPCPGGPAPVHAECGGLTHLMSDLDGHPMCGVLAGSARFTATLTLGYRRRRGGGVRHVQHRAAGDRP